MPMCFLSTIKLVPNKTFILYFQQKNGVSPGIICQMKGLSHGLLYSTYWPTTDRFKFPTK